MQTASSRAHQIPHRLVALIGHVDRAQLPGAGEPREFDGIAPISLDALARLLRRERGRDHPTLVTLRLQPTVNHEAAGAGFVHEDEFPSGGDELAHGTGQRQQIAADPSIVTHLASSIFGQRDIN